jgi:hypothetical protein
MTFQVNGHDIAEAVQLAAFVGSALAMLIAGLLVWLMVRPPKHVRLARKQSVKAEMDPAESEELWHLLDRMEARLEVLERAMADQVEHVRRPALRGPRNDETFEPAEDGRDAGRTE